ncbi:uncharacterized protein LOC126576322 [Anopheles aquasalis]|uniref:uncharacterized protein LOC126576322 n=1 Tax=Anopheles aquasalis TaxID=42839 RepID=UPI00215AEE63|nr:uncharacterized protein LOC126576322 [Anopheles aquasalis]
MNRNVSVISQCLVLLLLVANGVNSQIVCYFCQNCANSPLEAISCGGGGIVNPTYPPTYPTTYPPTPLYPTLNPWYPTLNPWYPTLSTIRPWPKNYGYVCYRIQRWVPSMGQYVTDRGCAMQLQTYETTCNSVSGNQGYQYCEFCNSQLCNN